MGKKATTATEPGFTELVDGIVTDAHQLISQHLDLLKQEIKQELLQVKSAAVSTGAGAGLVALGGILGTQMLVHWLHKSTGLPLWGCYGIVGGLLGAAGAGLLNQAGRQAARVRLASLPQTTEALKENLAWLKEQTTVGRP